VIASERISPLHLRLLMDGADCARCPLGRNGAPGRPVASEYHGTNPPAVAIVGEAPGRREVQLGRPFVGPSGKLLDYACAKGGVARGEIAILNAAACGPIPSAADGMKEAAVAACRPRLLTELRRLRPRVVLATGAYALKAIGDGKLGITTVRGALLPLAGDIWEGVDDCPPPKFTSTFHPAHILRGGNGETDQPGGESTATVDLLFYFFLYDLSKAHRLAHGLVEPWRDELDLFTHDDDRLLRGGGEPCDPREFVGAIERVHMEAKEIGEYATDVETDGKDSIRCNLTAIAAATTRGGIAATWRAWNAVPEALSGLRQLFRSSLRCVIQNRIFDSIVLPRHGLPIGGPIDDTLLQHHAAFPGLPHKLDQIATQFFVVPPWKAEFRRGEKDEASLVLYNGRDAYACAMLRPELTRRIEANRTERVYEADRQQFSVATHMRRTGYYIDRVERARQSAVQHARLDHMRGQLTQDFAAIEGKWRDALARILAQKQRKRDPGSYTERVDLRWREIAERDVSATQIGLFKPKSKNDLVALFEVLRIPITDYTVKGAPVTDKKAMEAAAGRHPLMRSLIHLREAQHLLATYIDGLPVQVDGRVHPEYGPKITGRWGGRGQNVPKFVSGWPPEQLPDGSFRRRPSGDLICPRENPRAIVTAPTASEILALPLGAVDPKIRMRAMLGHGRILVGADFEQLELRIAGYLARDAFILDIFNRGLDPHAAFAVECFGAKFTDAEAEYKEICQQNGIRLKMKADLSKVTGLDDVTRARLAKPQATWSRLRDLTKRAEYCGIYGGKAETVYESIVKDFPEVQLSGLQAVIDRINQKMSGVVRWRNEQEVSARLNREIREQLLGRVRLFPLGNFNPNVVYNFPIQAFAASLLAKGIFRFVALTRPELLQLDELYGHGLLSAAWVSEMRERGYSMWCGPVDLLINGHDSLVAEGDEEDGDRLVEFQRLAMEQELSMGVEGAMKFPVEAAKGRRWSDT